MQDNKKSVLEDKLGINQLELDFGINELNRNLILTIPSWYRISVNVAKPIIQLANLIGGSSLMAIVTIDPEYHRTFVPYLPLMMIGMVANSVLIHEIHKKIVYWTTEKLYNIDLKKLE